MWDAALQIFIFSSKMIIFAIVLFLLIGGIFSIISKEKEKLRGKLCIKNLNTALDETTQELMSEMLPKKEFKKYIKQQKKRNKQAFQKNIFVLSFEGDIKASAVTHLRKEVTALLNIATPQDEIVIKIESPGGMVHAYGLAAAQLVRIREKNIPLTVIVDKVAASGGYLMACVANKILAAPFAIIGSIGVVVQLPNFNRLLKQKNIDFEQITAGNYKRTISLFGENTEEGRQKLKEEVEKIHELFKHLVQEYRPHLNIEKVSTGEYWLGKEAFELKLVDALRTSDDYLLEKSNQANLYEIAYKTKKKFSEKFSSALRSLQEQLFIK